MPSGLNSQGTKIYHTSAGAGDSPASYTMIENVTNISGPDGSVNLIDISHLTSTAKEYLPGLPDNGTLQLTCNFSGATKQMEMFDLFMAHADAEPFRLSIPTTSAATTFYHFWFSAIVTKWSLGAATDSKATLNITLQTTGGITYTTGS